MTQKADVIIIGTGMGGATIGYALAKAGMKVLFIEKGLSNLSEQTPLTGNFSETYGFRKKYKERRQILKKSGRYFTTIKDTSSFLSKEFTPFIGSGTGGGTALYGAILERFKAEDFTPKQFHSSTHSSFSIPKQWPVSYAEMTPYYLQAEELYGVRHTNFNEQGVEDPAIPDSISSANKKAWHQLKQNGKHPYLLPTATDNVKNCKDNCQSFLCAHHCKNDSEKCALRLASEEYNAELLDNCEVIELISDEGRIKEIHCKQEDKILNLTADLFILAAGALATPALLQKSNNLANSSGLVGKYLMRHYVDLFAVQLKGMNVSLESQKQIGFNDLYTIDQVKFGTVQSFGLMPPLEVVIEEVSNSLPFGLNIPVRFGMKLFSPAMRYFYQRYFQDKLIFASIVEDLPNKNNHVKFNKGQIEINYSLTSSEKSRIKKSREQIIKTFKPLPVTVMKQADNNQRIAHACGTCRFGDDPATSVLNKYNRTHDIENLYITDASFFPTSGGINPSLTIAANALRVADFIIKNRQQ